MATDIAKAYVQIIPSAEGISGNISNILNKDASQAGASSGKSFSSSFGGAVGTGLKTAAGAATVAASGLAALGKVVVGNAKETAAYGDNVDKLSQKIGISAEAFQEWDYVFSQNGADISILEGGMKKLSNSVADAASGNKTAIEQFEALGLSISDLNGLSQEDIFGKVIEQLQQMPEGAERTALASDLLGRSAMELGPLLNQTAADTQALKDQAHDLGMIMSDDAVKSSAAFTDSMDNMKRALTGAKNSIAADFLPGLTDITNGIANLVAGNEGATDEIANGFQKLGTSISAAIPSVIGAVTSIVEAIAKVAPEIITALSSSILQALPQLAQILSGLIPQIISAITALLPQLVQVGLEIIAQLAIGIAQSLPTLIPQIVEVVMQIIEILIQNIPLFLDAGVQLITGLAEGPINSIPVLIGYIPQIIQAIVDALIKGIPILIQGAIQLVTALVDALPQIVQAIVDALPLIIQGIADALPELVPALIEGSIQLTMALVAAFPQIIAILVASLPQIINAIVQGFAALGPALVQTFTNAVSSVAPIFNQLGSVAKTAWNSIKQAFAQVGSYFKQQFTTAVNGVKSAWDDISAFFKQIWEQIKNVFADAGSKFREVGRNIVEGIKNGIQGAWDSVASWVKGKIQELVDSVKGLLDIHSPSKVFADEVGQWIPAGIAMGIENGMGVLDDQIKTMTDEALVGTITATTESVNSMNYVPNSPIQAQDNKMYQLLSQYLPILADKDVNIDIRQNDRGTYEIVRQQNMILSNATGYHALA